MNNDMFGKCGMTQFVGVGVCDTIGLYIANIDDDLRKQMNIPKKFHAVGLIGSRTGAGAQIQAVDDAVKATSTEVISIEIPRDTKGWGGHGNFIIIGGETPADVKRAVELALEYIDINAVPYENITQKKRRPTVAPHCRKNYSSPSSIASLCESDILPVFLSTSITLTFSQSPSLTTSSTFSTL